MLIPHANIWGAKTVVWPDPVASEGPRGRLLCHDLSGGGPASWATLPHMASVFGALSLNAFSFSGFDRPAYLSKSRLTAGIHHFTNEAEMEDRLASAGVEIFHPQEMTFTAQVALFGERALIMGGPGSAFHTAIFAAAGGRSLCLSPGSTIHSSYLLLDQVSEREAVYVCPVEDTSTSESTGFQSSHTLANAREAAEALLRLAGI